MHLHPYFISNKRILNFHPIFLLLLLTVNILGFIYYLFFFKSNGYLPTPFFYDKSNTFMDFFNPMFWAYKGEAYKDWGTIYPPLSFLLLKLIFLIFHYDMGLSSFDTQASGRVLLWWVIALYTLVCFFVFQTNKWKIFTWKIRFLIFLITILSPPFLYALERGNLILLAPFFLAVVLSRNGILRALALSILINLKPYFVILFFLYIVIKDFKGLLHAVLLTVFLFVLSGLFFDSRFLLFFQNIFNFSHNISIFSGREIIGFPSSISAFSFFLKNPNVINLLSRVLRPDLIKIISLLIELFKWSVLFFSAFTLIKKINSITQQEVLSILVVIISNLGVWVGGYTLILYFTLIPVLFKMRFRVEYFYILALIAMPLDIISLTSDDIGIQYSYLYNSLVKVHWTLGLGSLLRPILNLFLLSLLTYEIFKRKNF